MFAYTMRRVARARRLTIAVRAGGEILVTAPARLGEGEIKNLFERGGGSLAGPGAVSFNFESKGFLLIKKTSDPDSQMLTIIDMGVEDITDSVDGLEVYVAPDKLGEVKNKVEEVGFEVSEVELQMKPKNLIEVSQTESDKIVKFLETLESHDDIQKVYANI